jgi:membrane-associated protease RseP (regulator of RpoE activity)
MCGCRYKFTGGSLVLVALLTLIPGRAMEAQERGEEQGYIGIDFDDSSCRAVKAAGGEVVVWLCQVPPVVNTVYETGPAYRAGIRPGDVIVGVNGLNIMIAEGGRQFGSMRRGVPVTFHLRRNGQEIVLTVTPASWEEAFPQELRDSLEAAEAAESAATPEPMVGPMPVDSLRVQMREIYEGQVKLTYALKNAERALRITEAELARAPSGEQQELVGQLRLQIDSINERLLASQMQIRVHLDTLAMRTWSAVPRAWVEPPEVSVAVPQAEYRSITIYSDAVAGARFQELDEDSPLIDYFPGVEQGLLIMQVVVDTPAHVAGLRAGDVVVEVDGEPVATVDELRRLMRGEVELTYIRRGRKNFCTIPSR